MVSFWWETHGQNVPQTQLRRSQTPREKVMAMVPRATSCWEGEATVLGPSLAWHWNVCSHDLTQRGSHQLRLDHVWAGGWPQAEPGNCLSWVCSLL